MPIEGKVKQRIRYANAVSYRVARFEPVHERAFDLGDPDRGPLTVRHNASMTRACSTCRARRLGWSASGALRASANTIFPTCLPTPISRRSPPRSRRDGSASKPSATQGRTRPRSLRRPILASHASPRAHDDDRLRLPAKPPPRRGGRGRKNPPRAAQPDTARDPARRARRSRSRAAISMSPLQTNAPKTPRINLPK